MDASRQQRVEQLLGGGDPGSDGVELVPVSAAIPEGALGFGGSTASEFPDLMPTLGQGLHHLHALAVVAAAPGDQVVAVGLGKLPGQPLGAHQDSGRKPRLPNYLSYRSGLPQTGRSADQQSPSLVAQGMPKEVLDPIVSELPHYFQ